MSDSSFFTKSTMKFVAVLLLVSATTSWALYVDEPLLYDTFPTGFIWAAATSAHQVNF